MPRFTTLIGAALIALALAAAPGVSPAATAHAAKLKTCQLKRSEWGHLGPTYVETPFKVRSVTCARGKEVIRAFHACRKSHGGKTGRCPHRQSVLGYHCTELRTHNAFEIIGKVTCVFGKREVLHYYNQNTH